MNKIKIKCVGTVYHNDYITCCSTLDEVLSTVQNLISEYGKESRIIFNSGYNSIDERLEVDTFREETYKEYKLRVKREAKKLDKERAEYERLRLKFEGFDHD